MLGVISSSKLPVIIYKGPRKGQNVHLSYPHTDSDLLPFVFPHTIPCILPTCPTFPV